MAKIANNSKIRHCMSSNLGLQHTMNSMRYMRVVSSQSFAVPFVYSV